MFIQGIYFNGLLVFQTQSEMNVKDAVNNG
jgi:hypothetical protein